MQVGDFVRLVDIPGRQMLVVRVIGDNIHVEWTTAPGHKTGGVFPRHKLVVDGDVIATAPTTCCCPIVELWNQGHRLGCGEKGGSW